MTTSYDLLLKPGQGNSLSVVGDIFTFKAVSEDTNGQYTLVELRVDPEIGCRDRNRSRSETKSILNS
jgi:hypothetical protein